MKSRTRIGIVGFLVSLAFAIGCNQPPSNDTSFNSAPEVVTTAKEKPAPAIPKPASDKITFSSAEKFTAILRTYGYASHCVSRPSNIHGRHLATVGSSSESLVLQTEKKCRYLLPAKAVARMRGTVVDVDTLCVYEKVCGQWTTREGVTVDGLIFPSEVDTTQSFPLMLAGYLRTGSARLLSDVPDEPQWRLVERGDRIVLSTGFPLPDSLDNISLEKGVEVGVEWFESLELNPIRDHNIFMAIVREMSNEFHRIAWRYSQMSSARQEKAAVAIAKVVSPLARFVDREIVERYLLDVSWWEVDSIDLEIVDWPYNDPNMIVKGWGISANDHYMRAWWRRRGVHFYVPFRRTVAAELGVRLTS